MPGEGSRRGTLVPLRYLEAAQAFGLLLADVDALDAGAARALSAEVDEPLDRLALALEHGLHGAVRAVADPAGDATGLRQPPRRIAEVDALDVAVDDDAAALHAAVGYALVRAFVDEVAAATIGTTFNFYRAGGDARLRRERLIAYLDSRAHAGMLLVGEAAGWRGARVSGVPFTSERQLTGTGPAEASATIVQRTLAELGLSERVLLWNLVPTHPHRPGVPCSNRPPTRSEIAAGRRFLVPLERGRRVVAVGRLAEAELGPPAVRHPSHGGARAFRAGLLELLAT